MKTQELTLTMLLLTVSLYGCKNKQTSELNSTDGKNLNDCTKRPSKEEILKNLKEHGITDKEGKNHPLNEEEIDIATRIPVPCKYAASYDEKSTKFVVEKITYLIQENPIEIVDKENKKQIFVPEKMEQILDQNNNPIDIKKSRFYGLRFKNIPSGTKQIALYWKDKWCPIDQIWLSDDPKAQKTTDMDKFGEDLVHARDIKVGNNEVIKTATTNFEWNFAEKDFIAYALNEQEEVLATFTIIGKDDNILTVNKQDMQYEQNNDLQYSGDSLQVFAAKDIADQGVEDESYGIFIANLPEDFSKMQLVYCDKLPSSSCEIYSETATFSKSDLIQPDKQNNLWRSANSHGLQLSIHAYGIIIHQESGKKTGLILKTTAQGENKTFEIKASE